MTQIYFAMIILPLIFFVITGFVFGSFTGGVNSITNMLFLINCPFPLENQHVIVGSPPMLPFNQALSSSVGATYINYTVQDRGSTSVSNSTATGGYFVCYITSMARNNVPTPQPAFNQSAPNYGMTVLYFPVGWFAWLGDTGGAVTAKMGYAIQLVYIFLTAPADVSGIVWFNLITAILLLLFAVGIFMIVRGSG